MFAKISILDFWKGSEYASKFIMLSLSWALNQISHKLYSKLNFSTKSRFYILK